MTSLPKSCPRCTGIIFKRIILPDTHIHYGKVVCSACDTHINWIPNPKVTADFEARKAIIDSALEGDRVNSWERIFFQSISERRYLLPKQQERYSLICSRHKLQPKEKQ